MYKNLIIFAMALFLTLGASAQNKREFRGAWIQCVNGQFMGKSTQQIQSMLSKQLDELERDGVNAIIFQVRAECDALYESQLEPWSKFLTGIQGQAPNPYWDPLAWMVEQCHKRGMEIHAWINPYRAKHGSTSMSQVSKNSVVVKQPNLCFSYDNLVLLNPGLQESADYVCKVAADIVSRYDVDGFHIDDYFYPYPVAGKQIPDQALFQQNSHGYWKIGDWRRDNVSRFVKQLGETIHHIKPWVKFGVSPFGIYRNKKNDPNGSDTRGLQNYDDLYADVLMWINNGWVDYNIPQIYWEIGHPAADYDNLIHWWAKHAASRPLFIGQDVMRTVNKADARNPLQNQMPAKMKLQRSLPTVQGSCQWYAAAVVDNAGNYRTMLEKEYHRYPALIPESPFMDDKAPGKVKKVKMVWTYEGPVLFWTAPKAKDEMDKAVQYVVYRFDKKEKVNLDDASHIVAITRDHFYPLPYNDGKTKYQYVVTALDRLHNESKGTKKKVKL